MEYIPRTNNVNLWVRSGLTETKQIVLPKDQPTNDFYGPVDSSAHP